MRHAILGGLLLLALPLLSCREVARPTAVTSTAISTPTSTSRFTSNAEERAAKFCLQYNQYVRAAAQEGEVLRIEVRPTSLHTGEPATLSASGLPAGRYAVLAGVPQSDSGAQTIADVDVGRDGVLKTTVTWSYPELNCVVVWATSPVLPRLTWVNSEGFMSYPY